MRHCASLQMRRVQCDAEVEKLQQQQPIDAALDLGDIAVSELAAATLEICENRWINPLPTAWSRRGKSLNEIQQSLDRN